MNANKPQQRSPSFELNSRTDTYDLTQQERRTLSLIWRDDDSKPVSSSAKSSIEYCAEPGYN